MKGAALGHTKPTKDTTRRRNRAPAHERSTGTRRYEQGDYLQAARLNREALALMHQLGDRHGIAITLLDLGDALTGQGEVLGAEGSYAECLALFRDLGHTWGIARVLNRMGEMARQQGSYERAWASFTEGLTLSAQIADKAWVAASLEGLSRLAHAQGRWERVARLFGAASGLRERIGAPLTPAEAARDGELMATVRTRLGESAFIATWQAGQRLNSEQAVQEGLEP